MEIVNHRRKMLDATESNAKRNDDFAIKVTSMENVEEESYVKKKQKTKEIRRKNQTYFFHFPSYYLE